MRISLNDTVEFSLTEYGAEVWNKHYADFPNPYRTPATAGPMSEPLWVVMRILGPSMCNGGPSMCNGGRNAIDLNILIASTVAVESLAAEAKQLEAKQLEAKLAAYAEAFARAQRTLLDAANMLRRLRSDISDISDISPFSAGTMTIAYIDDMIDACNLAAMNPGVVKHSKRRAGVTFDTGGSSFDEALGEAIEAACSGREWVYIEHGGARMQVQPQDTISGATARWMKDVYGKPGNAECGPVAYETDGITVILPAIDKRGGQLIDLAKSIGITSGSWTLPELAEQARVRRETRDELLALSNRTHAYVAFRGAAGWTAQRFDSNATADSCARTLSRDSGRAVSGMLEEIVEFVASESKAEAKAQDMPWSVGAGRLSVELHALTDLLALARSLGAEVGTFTVHELARIAGDLHASSYVEHSIALNQIHAILNNMPEPTGPMTSGSEAAVSSTIERVRILVDVLRKATDALVAGGAS